MRAQTEGCWLPGLKIDLIQLCRLRLGLYFVCVCMNVCVYACLVFMGWQADPQKRAQHMNKWDRIERVPARPYKLDPASWNKEPRELVLEKEVAPSQTVVAPIFFAVICFTQACTQDRVQK